MTSRDVVYYCHDCCCTRRHDQALMPPPLLLLLIVLLVQVSFYSPPLRAIRAQHKDFNDKAAVYDEVRGI